MSSLLVPYAGFLVACAWFLNTPGVILGIPFGLRTNGNVPVLLSAVYWILPCIFALYIRRKSHEQKRYIVLQTLGILATLDIIIFIVLAILFYKYVVTVNPFFPFH